MAEAASSGRAGPPEKRPRLERPRSRAAAAEQQSMRFGAPASVVDPLLSLLYRLRQLEETVVGALTQLGVSVGDLPGPLQRAHSGAPAASVADVAEAAEGELAAADPISAYTADVAGTGAVDAEARASVVDAVLSWVDQSEGGPHNGVSSRRILAGLVANLGASAPLIVSDGGAGGDGSGQRREGSSSGDEVLRFVDSTPSPAVDGATQLACIGQFGEADVTGWHRYSDALSGVVAEMHGLLGSLCASTVANRLPCHAKWVEAAASAGVGKPSALAATVPSCRVVRDNYEAVIRLNDALATCQSVVWERLSDFEAALDLYVDEAAVVCDRERQCWQTVRAFEREYNALRAVKRGVTHVQKAFRRKYGIPIHPVE